MSDSIKKVNKHNTFLHLLIIIFGIGIWIVVNGLYNQLPLLIRDAPEGWSLPSYMNITVQLANIGIPLTILLKNIFGNKFNDVYYIYFMMSMTCASALLLAFFHKKTFDIGEKSYSVVLLGLLFVSAYYGCTSYVTSYPYLKAYQSIYITSFFVGEGVSLFLPSMVSLVQGVNRESDCDKTDTNEIMFGTKEFILFLFATMLLSLVTFILMNNLKICKSEQLSCDVSESRSNEWDLETTCWFIVTIVLAFVLYGIHPSIKSYSALPYGYKAYHLSIVLTDMSNPIICSIPFFITQMSTTYIVINLLIGIVSTIYVIVTAIQSPSPILVDTNAGTILIVIAWIVASGVLNLIKIIIATKFRDKGDKWMMWCGVGNQLGAASGSATGFILINYVKLFVERDLCIK